MVRLVSATVDAAANMDLFQRTAQWVFAWRNEPIDSDELQQARKVVGGSDKLGRLDLGIAIGVIGDLSTQITFDLGLPRDQRGFLLSGVIALFIPDRSYCTQHLSTG